MSTIISIDWDFFLFNACEAETVPTYNITLPDGREAEVSGLQLFDWQMSEGRSSFLTALLWQTRAAGFYRLGMTPKSLVPLTTPTEVFTEALGRRVTDVWGQDLFISDSHAWGSSLPFDGTQDLLLFDAHHDMGYDPQMDAEHVEKGVNDCSNWVYSLLERELVASVTVVYPDWRGMEEWSRFDKARPNVRAMTWSQWLASSEPLEVECVHVCRSSQWTPPWWDGAFEELVRQLRDLLETPDFHCLDCDPYCHKIGDHDACTPRDWNSEAARQHGEMMRQNLPGGGS